MISSTPVPEDETVSLASALGVSGNMIYEHMKEIALRSASHHILFTKTRTLRRLVGFPQTLISGFLSSALSIGLITDNHKHQHITDKLSLSMSLISFILCVTEQYFRLSEKESSHDMSSKLYTSLLRNIQLQLVNRRQGVTEHDIYTDIVQQMNVIEQYELPIPKAIMDVVKKEACYLDLVHEDINLAGNSRR